MNKKCIFCKISQKQIPINIVYEDNSVLVFKDIKPKAKFHFLIITKKHIKNINYICPENSNIIKNLFIVAKKIAKKYNIHDSGYRLIINNNKDAGQEIDHLHIHLLGGNKL